MKVRTGAVFVIRDGVASLTSIVTSGRLETSERYLDLLQGQHISTKMIKVPF